MSFQAKEKRAAERKAKKDAEKAAATAAKMEESGTSDKGPETAPSDRNHGAEETGASAAADAEAPPAGPEPLPEGTVTEPPVAKVSVQKLLSLRCQTCCRMQPCSLSSDCNESMAVCLPSWRVLTPKHCADGFARRRCSR